MSDSRWEEVWECPRCGLQLAWGEHGQAVQAVGAPTCTMGHPTVEMEQKLSEAFPAPPSG